MLYLLLVAYLCSSYLIQIYASSRPLNISSSEVAIRFDGGDLVRNQEPQDPIVEKSNLIFLSRLDGSFQAVEIHEGGELVYRWQTNISENKPMVSSRQTKMRRLDATKNDKYRYDFIVQQSMWRMTCKINPALCFPL